MLSSIILIKTTILLIVFIHQTNGANEILALNKIGSCANKITLKPGDVCQFQVKIILPTSQTLYAELFTSDFNSSYMPLCKPSIQFGSNLQVPSQPIVNMIPISSTLGQYDLASIDFGTITNSNISSTNESNTLTITFNTIAVDMGQVTGSLFYVSVGIDLLQNNESWVAQETLNYTTDTTPETMTTNGNLMNSTSSTELGKTGIFDYELTVTSLRYFSVIATATTTSTTQLSICSILVKSAGMCFDCVDSLKTFTYSTYDANNVMALDLGYITNIGFNNNTITGNKIIFTVRYRVQDTAPLGASYSINFKLNISHKTLTGTTLSATHTVTTIAQLNDSSTIPVPVIDASINKTQVSVNEPFRIRVTVDLPATFDHLFQVDAIGSWNTSDGKARMKLCGVKIKYTGDNVPCKYCLNTTRAKAYSINKINPNALDRFIWQVQNVKNYNLRTSSESSTANKLIFDIYGQIVDHPDNTVNSNTSVFLFITMGRLNPLIYTQEITFKIGSNTSVTSGYPTTYSISIADLYSSLVDPYSTRQLYFDINTTAVNIYQPITVEVLMSETQISNGIPAGSICRVKVHYVGTDVSCVQKDVINKQVTYESNLNPYKKDKANVNLGLICNTADTFDFNLDSVIRILIYFQLDELPTSVIPNYITVGLDNLISPSNINDTSVYVTQILVNKTANLNYIAPSITSFPIYVDTLTTKTHLNAGDFGVADVIIKLPPNTKIPFNIETRLSGILTTGYFTLCTYQFIDSGDYVPCTNYILHSFSSDANSIKTSAFSNAGVLCSVNNVSTGLNTQSQWDDDSLKLRIITRISDDVNIGATYRFDLFLRNGLNNNTLAYTNWQWTINGSFISSTYNATASFQNTDTNSEFYSLNSPNFYISQTIILSYKLTLYSGKTNDLNLDLYSSNLINSSFDIQKFFIYNIGDNLPCTKSNLLEAIYERDNISQYANRASLSIGSICNFPIDPNNHTADTLTIFAYVRIPSNSSLTGTATFKIDVKDSNGIINSLSKTLTGTIQPASSLNTNLTLKQIFLTPNASITNVTIRQAFNYSLKLNIPPYTSVKTSISFTTLNGTYEFANIKSIDFKMGRNINGAMNDFNKGIMKPVISSTAGSEFYNDQVVIDFGIITNTFGDYNPNEDDFLIVNFSLVVTDDLLSDHNSIGSLGITINYSSIDTPTQQFTELYEIVRTGYEAPLLNITAFILNDLSLVYTNSSILTIQFDVKHLDESQSEALDTIISFFLPNYITFKEFLIVNSSNISQIINGTQVQFKYSTLYFDQVIKGLFKIEIDPLNNRANYVKIFGKQALQEQIPFLVECSKTPRTLPIVSNMSISRFSSQIDFISYSTPEVTLTQIPNDQLKEYLSDCQIISSVNDVNTSSFLTIGWKTGYRSIKYYKSKATYLQIAFGTEIALSRLLIRQFLISSTTTPFSKFQLSFSLDNNAYSYLPEESFNTQLIQTNTAYDYLIPNGPISCSYLRIHITDIESPSELNLRQTGLRLDEIYGSFISPIDASICLNELQPKSQWYSPRSVLYNSFNKTIYVCDETTNRKSTVCFTSTDTQPTIWKELTPSVSTIVFYLFDFEELRYSLFGVSYDKLTLVRSDDDGLSWLSISLNQFNTEMNNGMTNINRYAYGLYNKISLATIPNLTVSPWTADIYGLSQNGILRYDWFN